MISRGREQKTKILNLVTTDWFLGGIELHFHLLDGKKNITNSTSTQVFLQNSCLCVINHP